MLAGDAVPVYEPPVPVYDRPDAVKPDEALEADAAVELPYGPDDEITCVAPDPEAGTAVPELDGAEVKADVLAGHEKIASRRSCWALLT